MNFDMDYENTLDKDSFVYYNVVSILLFVRIYKQYMLKNIDGISEQTSLIVFWITVIVISVLLISLEWKRSRNWISLLSNILCVCGVYTILSYMNYMHVIIAVIGIAGILSAIYSVIVFARKIRNRTRRIRIIKNRIHLAVSGTRKLFSVGFAVIFLLLTLDNYGIIGTDAVADAYTTYDEMVYENRETLGLLLDDEAWSELSINERVDVLQTVADIEQYRLGIPFKLNVRLGIMDEYSGCYIDEYHQIVVKADLVAEMSPYDLATTVCHEAFHAYEYCLVQLYENADESMMDLALLKKASYYKEEFENYCDGEDDFLTYYNQTCECDAREYAEAAMESYFFILTNILTGDIT